MRGMGYSFVSGNLALDFAGTLRHRRTHPSDLLASPADLAAWAVDAGLLDEPPAASQATLSDAIALREAIYRLATRTGRGPDLDLVNAAAAREPVRVRLDPAGGLQRDGDIAAALALVARSAVELLGGHQPIHECEDPECTRLYVDTSRRGARRWCDMRGCGNRAKVAAFRSRRVRTGAG